MAFRKSGGPPFGGGRGRIRGKIPQKDEHRINHHIRVPRVRLVDHKGQQVGVVPTRDAQEMARKVELDLVEISPKADPPVCKILDYGKYKYEKKKKENIAKKKQTVIKVKEVQLRPNTDTHDLDYKFRNARTFLEGGDKVKFTMIFRGRQMVHADQATKVMKGIADRLVDVSTIEFRPKMEGRKMIMILAPTAKKLPKGTKKKAEEPESAAKE